MGFRQGVNPPPLNEPLKSPLRLGLKTQKLDLCIKIQSISVLFDTTKVAHYNWENADDINTQWVYWFIFFTSTLDKV